MVRLTTLYCSLALLSAAAMAGPILPPTHYKHRVTDEVCRRIAAAYGNPLVRPRLEIWSKPGQIALFDVEPGGVVVLRLDERLYDRCRTYGPDSLHALACLIGHELGHFYQQQGFIPAYGPSSGLVSPQPARTTAERTRKEAEADRFGLYYGYLAGYDTYRLLPSVLRAVYADYRLSHQLPGYPSLNERLALAEEERRRFRPLALAFEAGQLLWMTQHYEAAISCFSHVLNQFRSKEVYNNLGVIRLTQALGKTATREVPYAYPFEWDPGHRLRLGSLRSGPANGKQVAGWLQQAKEYFKGAEQLDPTYATAAVNLACTYSLLGNQEGSISTIQELEEVCRTQQVAVPANAYLVKGIAYAQNQQSDRAKPYFAQAVLQNAFRAEYNQDVFDKTQPQHLLANLIPDWSSLERWIRDAWSGPSAEPRPQLREEALGPFRFNDWLHRPLPRRTTLRDSLLLPHPTQPVSIIRQSAAGVTAMRLLTADLQMEILSTTPSYKGATRAGLRIGQPTGELYRRYGHPDVQLPLTGNRVVCHYKSLALLVETRNGRVSGWHAYRY
ncbi:hypothetical protein GCM10023187_51280 [Nibrella viscosa]|uniref:Tetratricopeptide repeat-containing protein n=1 Tax=Nibrella viscosa TaxID=1084524 RepID=A0ABP8KXR6_9BACT